MRDSKFRLPGSPAWSATQHDQSQFSSDLRNIEAVEARFFANLQGPCGEGAGLSRTAVGEKSILFKDTLVSSHHGLIGCVRVYSSLEPPVGQPNRKRSRGGPKFSTENE
jgi:hypothetical protein